MGLLAIATGVSIASSVLGFGKSRSARKKQRRAEELAAKRATIANIQNRRAAAAAIRRQQAVQVVGAMASGAAGGSADKATASSLASQGLASIATQTQQQELGQVINSTIGSANSAASQAQGFAAAAGLFGQVSNLASSLQAPKIQEGVTPNQN